MEHDTVEQNGKIFEMVKKNIAGLVIIESIVEWSQTAAHSLSSELRDPMVVGT